MFAATSRCARSALGRPDPTGASAVGARLGRGSAREAGWFGDFRRLRALHAGTQLHIRLLPLTVPKIPELDFYGSPEQVRLVVAGLDRFEAWARGVNPSWVREIESAR